tara:strand:- start:153 stop:458 length:306 start_codon:yes stop_codon:yes gene_type:complete
MAEFVLSRQARQDLIEIWTYIAEDNVEAADRFSETLLDAIRRLASMPGMGHSRKDLTDQGVLFWPVKSVLVVYRDRTPLEVVRVLSGYRDIAHLLDPPFPE